jgi:S1-C subfamily serine protease
MGQGFESKPDVKPPAWLPPAPDLNPWRQIAQDAQKRAATETVIPSLHYGKAADENDRTVYRPDELAARIYQESREAIVRIRNVDVEADARDHGGLGTGFFISKDGKLATAYHVVRGQNAQLEVDLADGRTLKAHVVEVKPLSDLAVLQVDGAAGQTFKPLELAETSRSVSPGDKVFSVGHPRGWKDIYLSEGTHEDRVAMHDTWIDQDASNPNRMLLQSSIHVAPGNSGSPLLNSDGKVVGVVSFSNGGTNGTSDTVDDLKSLLGTTTRSDYFPSRLTFDGSAGRNLFVTSMTHLGHTLPRRSEAWGARAGSVAFAAGTYSAMSDLANYDWRAFTTAWDNGTTAERLNSSFNLGADLSMLAGTAFYMFGGAKYRTAASVFMGTGSAAKLFNSLTTDRTY